MGFFNRRLSRSTGKIEADEADDAVPIQELMWQLRRSIRA
jgi:hypothetical protein